MNFERENEVRLRSRFKEREDKRGRKETEKEGGRGRLWSASCVKGMTSDHVRSQTELK